MPDIDVTARVGGRSLDVRFTVPAGEVLAVMGPNGSGKSTTVAVIAGLLAADDAHVRVGNRTITDTAVGLQVPPHDRRVGLLLQKPLLFPHLTVRGNVEFAARRRCASRAQARERAAAWLDLVGATALASRRPAQLSGGQSQRVAIARALAGEPEVLLLDEPLAGLDVDSAAAIRAVLRRVLAADGRPAILITHELLDVLSLADRVLILEGGHISETSSTTSFLASPRSDFGARLAGVNLVRGVVSAPFGLRAANGEVWSGSPADPADNPVEGEAAIAVFPPSAVAVHRARPQGSPRNTVRVTVAGVHATGPVVRVHATRTDPHPSDPHPSDPHRAADLVAHVTPEAVAELRLAVGDPVWFAVKAQEVRIQAARPARHD